MFHGCIHCNGSINSCFACLLWRTEALIEALWASPAPSLFSLTGVQSSHLLWGWWACEHGWCSWRGESADISKQLPHPPRGLPLSPWWTGPSHSESKQTLPFHSWFYQTFCQSREKSNLYPLGAEYYARWQAYERENRAFGLLLQVIELQSFQVH